MDFIKKLIKTVDLWISDDRQVNMDKGHECGSDFDWASFFLNENKERKIKLYELRFQIAIIIFPTIIDLWGFIGIIATSNLFEKYPLFIYLIVNSGILITFFLIWMWRARVHDLFYEEVAMVFSGIAVEGNNKIYNGKFFPNIENVKYI